MGRKCGVCAHRDVGRIDAAILNTTLGEDRIAKLYNLTPRQIQNHREKHLPAELLAHKAEEIAASIDEVWADFSLHRHALNDAIMDAYDEGDFKALSSLIGQASRRAEMILKLVGDMRERLDVNVTGIPLELMQAVYDQLKMSHPEASAELYRLLNEHHRRVTRG